MLVPSIASLLVLAGATLLYLASPNQQLSRGRVHRRRAGYGAAAFLLLGLVLLLQWAGPATAFFIALTLAMLAATLVPVAAAWVRRSKGGAR